MVIASQESKGFTMHTDEMTEALLSALAAERTFLFTWGKIEYEDFDSAHVTRYCFRYSFPTRKWAFHYKTGHFESD